MKFILLSLFLFTGIFKYLWEPYNNERKTLYHLQGPNSAKPTEGEFKIILTRAHNGEPISQLHMGTFYANGYIAQQDFQKAAEWYRKAADAGNPMAQRYLGLLYYNGIGVDQDYGEAYTWFMKAAQLGDAAAYLNLSAFPLFRRESIMDSNLGDYNAWRLKALYMQNVRESNPTYEASFWKSYYQNSSYHQNDSSIFQEVLTMSEKGDAKSQLHVAQHVLYSQGVAFDKDLFNYWLKTAATNNNHYAQFMIGIDFGNSIINHYSDKDKVQYLTMAAISNSEKYITMKARERIVMITRKTGPDDNLELVTDVYDHTLKELSDNGYLLAQFNYGRYSGNIINDWSTAFKMMKLCDEKGFENALPYLAVFEAFGLGTEINTIGAISALKRCASSNNRYLLDYLLPLCIKFYEKNAPDIEYSYKCMQLKAEEGDPFAMIMLSYFNASDFKSDEYEAALWLGRAAEKNIPAAYYLLGRFLRHCSDGVRDKFLKTSIMQKINQHIIGNFQEKLQCGFNDIEFALVCIIAAAESNYLPAMQFFKSYIPCKKISIKDYHRKIIYSTNWYRLYGLETFIISSKMIPVRELGGDLKALRTPLGIYSEYG
jgi:TPR repeat protein